MSTVGSYPVSNFSPTQYFLVYNPSSQTLERVLGSELVTAINGDAVYVRAVSTRAVAQTLDLEIGVILQTGGGTVAGDGGSGAFLVVATGEGDFVMNNGNELLALPRGSLAGSDLDGALVTDNGTVREIQDAITNRPVMFESTQALLLEDLTGYDRVGAYAFYTGWNADATIPLVDIEYRREYPAVTGTASTLYADNSGFYDANGYGFKISTQRGRVHLAQLGAVGDNSADDLLAFKASIDLGASLIEGDKLTYKITDRLVLLAANSNITFDLNGGTIAPSGAAVTNAFYIPAVGDGDAGVAGATNVTLRNLNTDGINAAAASGVGILTYNADTLTIENVQNDNWTLSGGILYGLASGAVSAHISNIRGTGNTNHAFAVSTVEEEASRIVVDGVKAWSNGLGFDLSAGSATVKNLYTWSNTNGGMKTAGNDNAHCIIDGLNSYQDGQGFYTNGTFRLLELDNINVIEPVSHGVAINHVGTALVGNVHIESPGGQGFYQFGASKTLAENISVKSATGRGVNIAAGDFQCSQIRTELSGNQGVIISSTGNISIQDHLSIDDCATSGNTSLAFQPGTSASGYFVGSLRSVDTRGVPLLTIGLSFNGNTSDSKIQMVRTSGVANAISDSGTDNTWLDANGQCKLPPDRIGFYGTNPAVKQEITGSRASNAALADLLTKLETIGLITDSSS